MAKNDSEERGATDVVEVAIERTTKAIKDGVDSSIKRNLREQLAGICSVHGIDLSGASAGPSTAEAAQNDGTGDVGDQLLAACCTAVAAALDAALAGELRDFALAVMSDDEEALSVQSSNPLWSRGGGAPAPENKSSNHHRSSMLTRMATESLQNNPNLRNTGESSAAIQSIRKGPHFDPERASQHRGPSTGDTDSSSGGGGVISSAVRFAKRRASCALSGLAPRREQSRITPSVHGAPSARESANASPHAMRSASIALSGEGSAQGAAGALCSLSNNVSPTSTSRSASPVGLRHNHTSADGMPERDIRRCTLETVLRKTHPRPERPCTTDVDRERGPPPDTGAGRRAR